MQFRVKKLSVTSVPQQIRPAVEFALISKFVYINRYFNSIYLSKIDYLQIFRNRSYDIKVNNINLGIRCESCSLHSYHGIAGNIK